MCCFGALLSQTLQAMKMINGHFCVDNTFLLWMWEQIKVSPSAAALCVSSMITPLLVLVAVVMVFSLSDSLSSILWDHPEKILEPRLGSTTHKASSEERPVLPLKSSKLIYVAVIIQLYSIMIMPMICLYWLKCSESLYSPEFDFDLHIQPSNSTNRTTHRVDSRFLFVT